jgi:hypothetical protein
VNSAIVGERAVTFGEYRGNLDDDVTQIAS